jgi:hypothetical protein
MLLEGCGPKAKFIPVFARRPKDCSVRILAVADTVSLTLPKIVYGVVNPCSLDVGDDLEFLGYIDVKASTGESMYEIEKEAKGKACQAGGDVIVYVSSEWDTKEVVLGYELAPGDLAPPGAGDPADPSDLPRGRLTPERAPSWARDYYTKRDQGVRHHLWLVYGKRRESISRF